MNQELLKSAQLGDVQAQYAVGYSLVTGEGADRDLNEGLEWLTKAAQSGNIGAQRTIGVMYFMGDGVNQDYHKAIEFFTQASDLGDVVAIYYIGLMNIDGNGMPQNFTKGLDYIKEASNKDCTEAQDYLGALYYHGKMIEKNTSLAQDLFLRSSQLGNINAMHHLAISISDGEENFQKYIAAYAIWNGIASQSSKAHESRTHISKLLSGPELHKAQNLTEELFKPNNFKHTFISFLENSTRKF